MHEGQNASICSILKKNNFYTDIANNISQQNFDVGTFQSQKSRCHYALLGKGIRVIVRQIP